MECTEWCKRTKLNVSSLLYCINGISKQIVTTKYRWGGRQNTRRRLPLFELLQTVSLIWQCFYFRSLTSCLLLLNFWTLLLSALNLHDFATKKLDSWETQLKCGLKVWRRKTKNEKIEGFYSEFLNHSERIGFRHVITFVETWFKRQRGSFNGKRGTLGTMHTKYYFSCRIWNARMIFESLELNNVVEQIQFIF